MDGPRAFLTEDAPLDSVPLESPVPIKFKDGKTGEAFEGYLVDVEALNVEDLHAIYADMRARFPNIPGFDAWVEIIKKDGMPIRSERVRSVAMDLRSVL